MDTLNLTKTLSESLRFERQFKLMDKAVMHLEKAKRYYKMRERKLQELDSETCVYFPAIKKKLQHQARKADVYYNFCDAQYWKTINKLRHNK